MATVECRECGEWNAHHHRDCTAEPTKVAVRAELPPGPTAFEECTVMADRHNTDKPQLSLVPAKALTSEAKVWALGAKKYGRDNWRKLWGDDTLNVCLDSALRHMVAMVDGDLYDVESGECHAAHVRCNMAMIIEYLSTRR